MEGSFGIELRGLWSDIVVRALGCCQSLRIVVAQNPTLEERGKSEKRAITWEQQCLALSGWQCWQTQH